MELSVFGGKLAPGKDFTFIPGAAVIFLVSLLLVRKWKVSPILIIVISAVLGILLT
jgi:hypothetical protein